MSLNLVEKLTGASDDLKVGLRHDAADLPPAKPERSRRRSIREPKAGERRYTEAGLPRLPPLSYMKKLLRSSTVPEIAAMYQRAPQTINSYFNRNQVRLSKKPPHDVIKRLAVTMTVTQAATHFDITEAKARSWSYQSGTSWVRKLGNYSCKLGLERDMVETLVGLYIYGLRMSSQRVAEVMCMPQGSVNYVKTILDGDTV